MISKGAGLAPFFVKDRPPAEDDPALPQQPGDSGQARLDVPEFESHLFRPRRQCDFLPRRTAIFGRDVGLCRLKKNEKKRILLAVMDASKTKRFSFLGEEQFAVLTAREKLAYLAAAMTELQRSSRPVSTPPQPEERESQSGCV